MIADTTYSYPLLLFVFFSKMQRKGRLAEMLLIGI